MNSQDIVDENELDSEALQAQIDLSMSFAQDLVNSWIQPHKFTQSSRKNDLEKELTDYMRRPPRLGVGASVPEGRQSISRETARLKGKLAGSKRRREEEEETASKQPSDEEGEGKATAIKKKARTDPFDIVHGKKKKQMKHTQDILSSAMVVDQAKDDSSGEVEDMLLDPPKSPVGGVANGDGSTPVKRKKKRRKAAQAEKRASPNPTHRSGSEGSYVSADNESVVGTPRKSNKALAIPEIVDVSATTTPHVPQTPKKNHLDLGKIALLNLNGPPNDPDSDYSATGTPSTSPKKKRKRRKKKKSNATITAPDTVQ